MAALSFELQCGLRSKATFTHGRLRLGLGGGGLQHWPPIDNCMLASREVYHLTEHRPALGAVLVAAALSLRFKVLFSPWPYLLGSSWGAG